MDKNPTFSDQTTIMASKDQVSCDLVEEAVVLSFKDGVYYGLNNVGARIWDFIQTPRTIEKIRELILEEYDVSSSQCESDLKSFLNEMLAKKLIVIQDETAA